MDAGTWLALVGACAAVAAAIFAYVQAKSATDSRRDAQAAQTEARDAQARAEAAQAEALRIAGLARDELSRSATALEHANEIAKSAIPEKKISWSISPVGKTRWMAQNVSEVTAYAAHIEGLAGWVHADDEEPRDVTTGDALYFNTMNAGGTNPRIRITCEDRRGDEPQQIVNEITMP